MCVVAFLYMCMLVYICQLCAWKLDIDIRVFCLSLSLSIYVLSWAFSLNLELADSAVLSSQLATGVPSPLSAWENSQTPYLPSFRLYLGSEL